MNRKSALVALCIMVAAIAAGSASAQQATAAKSDKANKEVILDRLVALVEGQERSREAASILLLSDLVLAARVDAIRVFGVEGRSTAVTEEMLQRVLKEELVSILVYREAIRYDIVAVTTPDILRKRDELASRIGGPAALDAWLAGIGVSIETLDALLHRRLVVETFLGYKKSEVQPPDEEELKKLYESGDHPFADKPFEDAKQDLFLFEQTRRTTAALKEWMTEIRQNARIRLF